MASSSSDEEENTVFIIDDDLEDLIVADHLHSRLINVLDRMLIVSAVLILAFLTSGAAFRFLSRNSTSPGGGGYRWVAELHDSESLSTWPVDIVICNGLCRKSAPKMLQKVFGIEDSCGSEELTEFYSLDDSDIAHHVAVKLNLSDSPNRVVVGSAEESLDVQWISPLDRFHMCRAHVTSQTVPRNHLTTVDLMGQVDESDMILSAKVCATDPTTLQCNSLVGQHTLCNSSCDFRIRRGLSYPACHTVSATCKGFGKGCRQQRFVLNAEHYDDEGLQAQLTMQFGNTTLEVLSGHETQIWLGRGVYISRESLVAGPHELSVLPQALDALNKTCLSFRRDSLEASYSGICDGLSSLIDHNQAVTPTLHLVEKYIEENISVVMVLVDCN